MAVTKASGAARQIADGYKQCFLEYGADYIFAAPLTVDDEIQLDFARLLADQSRGTAKPSIWLNVNDGGEEQDFRFNLPFSNWQDVLYPGASQMPPWRIFVLIKKVPIPAKITLGKHKTVLPVQPIMPVSMAHAGRSPRLRAC